MSWLAMVGFVLAAVVAGAAAFVAVPRELRLLCAGVALVAAGLAVQAGALS